MTTRDTNDIRELTTSELETVSGSSIVEGVRTAVTLAGCAAALVFLYAYGQTIDHQPDPWG